MIDTATPGRPRRSTVVLTLVFVAALVSYFLVRPAPSPRPVQAVIAPTPSTAPPATATPAHPTTTTATTTVGPATTSTPSSTSTSASTSTSTTSTTSTTLRP